MSMRIPDDVALQQALQACLLEDPDDEQQTDLRSFIIGWQACCAAMTASEPPK